MSTVEGYAVYDKTLERFVTGVHATETKAKDAQAELAKGSKHKFETRKV